MKKREQLELMINVHAALSRLPIMGHAAENFAAILQSVANIADALKAELAATEITVEKPIHVGSE